MVTPEEKLTTRLKVVERLKTNFPWLSNPARSLGLHRPGRVKTSELPSEAEASPVTDVSEKTAEPDAPLNLQSLLSQTEVQMPFTLTLGICEDGLPLIL